MLPMKFNSGHWPSAIFTSRRASLENNAPKSRAVAVDILLVAVLSIFAAFQFFSCDRYPDFLHEDVS
jgi:hypothetical protein